MESNPQPSPEQDPTNSTGLHGKDEAGRAEAFEEGEADATLAEEVCRPDPCPGALCPAGPQAAPDPSVNGPYPVGVATFYLTLSDYANKKREIRYEVWYPTLDEYRDGPFDAIDFWQDAPDEIKPTVEQYKDALPPIPVQVVRDAPVRVENGPYPLVLFSHGAYGIRFQSVFFTVPLASHGYVVASPDHTGNTLYNLLEPDGYNLDDLFESAMDRPLDLKALLDEMLVRSARDGDLMQGAIDPERVGASGHSFGGYATLNIGFTDPRIKAVLPQEPVTTPLGLLGFDYAEFPVPMMMMTGKLDKTLDTEAEMHAPFQKMPSPKYYFELTTGGHFTYSDICILDLTYIANDLGIEDADNALDDGCADYNIPTAVAQPIIRQFGIGFFNYYLRGSEGSAAYFDAAAAAKYQDVLLYEAVP
jgi:predicted dienelactone hydrolase